MKSISAILIYFGLQAIAGALLPSNIFLALLLSALVAIALFFVFKYISFKNYEKPQKTLEIVLLAILFLLPSFALQEILDIDSTNLEAIFSQIFISPVVAALCVGIAVPVAEEIMCRGLVQTQLGNLFSKMESIRHPEWFAIALSAAIFALFHLEPAQMPHAFLVGILLGWLRHKYSLSASTIFHVTNNLCVFVMTVALGEDVTLEEIFQNNLLFLGVSIFLATSLCVFLVYNLARSNRQ